MTKIYALVDPRIDKIFYVGRTDITMERRIYLHFIDSHLHFKHSARDKYFRDLEANGLQPSYVILEETTKPEAHNREAYWISFLLHEGAELVNGARPKMAPRKNIYWRPGQDTYIDHIANALHEQGVPGLLNLDGTPNASAVIFYVLREYSDTLRARDRKPGRKVREDK